jgi:isocitrate dehydrogenase kinase/phosphatase
MSDLAFDAAQRIKDAFRDYDSTFDALTRRARQNFERRDLAAQRRCATERIDLYESYLQTARAEVGGLLGERVHDRMLWREIRQRYAAAIAADLDHELYKTFYNSLIRRCFQIEGVWPDIEFVALDLEPTDAITHAVTRHSYANSGDLVRLFDRLLDEYRFGVAYADRGGDAARLATALTERTADWGDLGVLGVEMLETVFYRDRRAYLVGRALGEGRMSPLVVVLMNEQDGIRVDALISSAPDLAQVFGASRSFFLADLPTVGDAVVFLRTLLPRKPVDELYALLGRLKQAKTERYRRFFHHFERRPDELLTQAEGERGMVMAVFTLPSWPLVFKLVRDRFAFPKNVAREEVYEKYKFVYNHDRNGRLIEAQEFRQLRFPRNRFAPGLLEELYDSCRSSIREEGDDLIISHCYVERRLRPLNLFLKEAPPEQAIRAIVDYGQAIKDLARSNIFPGDLLLKNFGVTRNLRCVFYDYDELALVSDCRFRALPQARDDDEEMHSGAWFHVNENDVFPEQFPEFLGLTPALRQALMSAHRDIFDVRFWLEEQARIRRGEDYDVIPYPEAVRLVR